ncbi:alpha-L RNA-binding motif-containing protein [Exidia glandulosa HHB12029]|uniref:Alpha-L RNA-binding motif-containing protein n=1 Tax=Exidia glandulosa HHB12029 TaxID=1314781 RepID=A0A165KIR9_EXIGL|nr:alpha-L RNA-binding motif-containing protein [Exidia glandulosa HHB12029]
MRDRHVFSFRAALPRMSWGPQNLYNLWKRSLGQRANEAVFTKSPRTLFQQRWISKKLLRAYHGDYIPEHIFKRWYLPAMLPDVRDRVKDTTSNLLSFAGRREDLHRIKKLRENEEEQAHAPVGSLMWSEIERRIDTVIFRACLTHSVYHARELVIHRHVKLNGTIHNNPNTRLAPGDMVTVNPDAIQMLSAGKPIQSRWRRSVTPLTIPVAKPAPPPVEPSSSPSTSEAASSSADASASETVTSDGALPESPAESASGESSAEASSAEPSSEASSSEATSSEAPATEESEEPQVVTLHDADSRPSTLRQPREFQLPEFAAPFIFVPAYLEVSYPTCSVIYVRHPTARAGYSEIPTPYDADGEIMRLAWEWYAIRRPRVRSKKKLAAMPENRQGQWIFKGIDRPAGLLGRATFVR